MASNTRQASSKPEQRKKKFDFELNRTMEFLYQMIHSIEAQYDATTQEEKNKLFRERENQLINSIVIDSIVDIYKDPDSFNLDPQSFSDFFDPKVSIDKLMTNLKFEENALIPIYTCKQRFETLKSCFNDTDEAKKSEIIKEIEKAGSTVKSETDLQTVTGKKGFPLYYHFKELRNVYKEREYKVEYNIIKNVKVRAFLFDQQWDTTNGQCSLRSFWIAYFKLAYKMINTRNEIIEDGDNTNSDIIPSLEIESPIIPIVDNVSTTLSLMRIQNSANPSIETIVETQPAQPIEIYVPVETELSKRLDQLATIVQTQIDEEEKYQEANTTQIQNNSSTIVRNDNSFNENIIESADYATQCLIAAGEYSFSSMDTFLIPIVTRIVLQN